jgi:hypothetical protein
MIEARASDAECAADRQGSGRRELQLLEEELLWNGTGRTGALTRAWPVALGARISAGDREQERDAGRTGRLRRPGRRSLFSGEG